MAKVLLGDVAKERKEVCKGSKARLPIVGLEHLTPGEITLSTWSDDSENTFTKMFHKGDMLFGRRRAYLKKAAVAPFDGICSGDITVIEAIPGRILPELLPFIIQNDDLFDFAVGKSAGSLSPRVKWEHLKNYEFELPDMEKQKELAELLWAMDMTKKAYQELIAATDELVKSQFIVRFGDPVNNQKGLPVMKLSDIATSRLGKMLDAKKQTGQNRYPYLANFNVQWFRVELDVLNEMDFDEKDRAEFELQDGDLLVCEGGEVGRCAIWHNQVTPCYYQKAVHRVRCNTSIVLPEYLAWWFKIHSDMNGFADVIGTSTIAHLPGVKLKAMMVSIPTIPDQRSFLELTQQSDKSKFELEQALAELTATYKSIIAENLG